MIFVDEAGDGAYTLLGPLGALPRASRLQGLSLATKIETQLSRIAQTAKDLCWRQLQAAESKILGLTTEKRSLEDRGRR